MQRVGLVLLLSALLVGCEPTSNAGPHLDGTAELRAAALVVATPSPVVMSALDVLTTSCLQERGILRVEPLRLSTLDSPNLGGIVGVQGVQSASEFGFSNLYPDPDSAQVPATTGGGAGSETTVTFEVDGLPVTVPIGTCEARAATQVFGSVETHWRIAHFGEVLRSHIKDVRGSEAVQDLVAAYSRCMADHGWNVANPKEMQVLARRRYLAARAPNDPPSAEEVAAATTDARCAQQNNLVARASEIVLDDSIAYLADNRSEVTRLAWTVRRAERLANEVLASKDLKGVR